ncbi:MAG TPA: hypothetical protein PK566_15950, partial [Pseudobacteroides sp.]|nr:hypothetical protein [Pseudobacteroides sp.]
MLLKTAEKYINAKKIICLMLVLFNMLVFLPVNNYAAEDKPTIIVGFAEGKVGDIVNIPIKFINLPENKYINFQFKV